MTPSGGGNSGSSSGGGVSPGDAQQGVQAQQGSTPPDAVQGCPGPTTWVEFCLVDMEGNPVGGKRYRAQLPGGATPEGTLPQSGCVRFDGIQPGMASISFPEFDQDAWEPI